MEKETVRNCDCSDFTLVKESEFCCKSGSYNLEVLECKNCGKHHYGYDGWINPKWESLYDVKEYLRSLR